MFNSIAAPIVSLLNQLMGPLLAVVGAAGALYCVLLGVKFAQAVEPQDREKAKGALKNAIIGFMLIFVLILALNLLMPTMISWVNQQAGSTVIAENATSGAITGKNTTPNQPVTSTQQTTPPTQQTTIPSAGGVQSGGAENVISGSQPVVETPKQDQGQSPAPQQETPAPQQETPAPQQETPAPQQETPAPQQETPAPQQETPAPQEETPAPQEETPAPQQETPAPQEETPAPQEETPAPQEETPAPQQETPQTRTHTDAERYEIAYKTGGFMRKLIRVKANNVGGVDKLSDEDAASIRDSYLMDPTLTPDDVRAIAALICDPDGLDNNGLFD